MLRESLPRLEFAVLPALFNAHVPEFARLEDLSALDALHELGIFVAADDLHPRMFTGLTIYALRRSGRLWGHKSGMSHIRYGGGTEFAGISGILKRLRAMSSPRRLHCREFVTSSHPPFPFQTGNPTLSLAKLQAVQSAALTVQHRSFTTPCPRLRTGLSLAYTLNTT